MVQGTDRKPAAFTPRGLVRGLARSLFGKGATRKPSRRGAGPSWPWRDATEIPGLFGLAHRTPHNVTTINGDGPVTLTTHPDRWWYAASFPLDHGASPEGALAAGPFVVRVRLQVHEGVIGVGLLAFDGATFLAETLQSPSSGIAEVNLRADDLSACRELLLRNASASGASRVTVHGVDVYWRSAPIGPFPHKAWRRHQDAEPKPHGTSAIVFDDGLATTINKARLDHLAKLPIDFRGKRVLDVGCGVGHFSRFYSSRGCAVVGIDGREENIARMRQLYPDVTGHVRDVQADGLADLGRFDVLHCYGLLYHLENPCGVLRKLHDACCGMMVLETIVCDALRPVMVLEDEDASANQAMNGLACRPSPSFVAMALNRAGFPYVYTPRSRPDHEDFLVTWKDNLEYRRDNHNLRCIFVASRTPIDSPELISMLD